MTNATTMSTCFSPSFEFVLIDCFQKLTDFSPAVKAADFGGPEAADFGGDCPPYTYRETPPPFETDCCWLPGCCMSGCTDGDYVAEKLALPNAGPMEVVYDDGQGRNTYRTYWKGKSIAVAGYLYQYHTGD